LLRPASRIPGSTTSAWTTRTCFSAVSGTPFRPA
jgi:hypothetical protein